MPKADTIKEKWPNPANATGHHYLTGVSQIYAFRPAQPAWRNQVNATGHRPVGPQGLCGFKIMQRVECD